MNRTRAGAVVWMGLWMVGQCVEAGQIASHIYTAAQSRNFLSGDGKTVVNAKETAYFSGAQGPDACGIVQNMLDRASIYNSVGEETHYDDRKNELAVNILECATTPAEKAFALGWITHYLNDVQVHALVNRYGGYYAIAAKHHKELEMLETKLVFANHGGVVTPARNNAVPEDAGATFAGFIFNGYHATYPTNELYKFTRDSKFIGTFDGREYFGKRYQEAAGNSREVGGGFYTAHTNGTGVQGTAKGVAGFPSLPSTAQYNLLLKPLELVKFEREDDLMRVKVKVNDSKLYGCFLVEWEEASRAAARSASTVLPLACRFLGESNATLKADLKNKLIKVVPAVNLDQPLGTSYDAAKAVPGNVQVEKLTYRLEIFPRGGKPQLIEGKSPPIKYSTTNFCGSTSGAVDFDIPLPAGVASGNFKLRISLSGIKKFYSAPKFKNVDWVENTGVVARSICFQVDCSGSMAGSKIKEAIAALKQSVSDSDDGKTEWAILTFSGCYSGTRCQFTLDADKVRAAADGLGTGGDTPLAFGTAAATRYLVKSGSGRTGQLIVLADGEDNCSGGPDSTHRGEKPGDEAAAAFRPMFEKKTNVPMPDRGAP